MPKAYIISDSGIIPEGYIIRDHRERISLKKALPKKCFFLVEPRGIALACGLGQGRL